MAAMASCELASGDLGNPWLDQLPGVFAGAFLRHGGELEHKGLYSHEDQVM